MQKNLLSIAIAATLLVSSACQPNSNDKNSSVEPTSSTEKQSTQLQPQLPKAEKTVTNTSKPAVNAKTCLDLNQTMQKIGDTNKIEAIYKVQEQLEACLPTASNAEVLTLLKSYQALYSRFLGTDLYMDGEDFYEIAEALDKGKSVSKEQLAVLNPRIQYLVRQVEGKADVSILYVGEGIYVFHHDLKAMADIFAPYLPKDQQAFIERMAKDNQDIFWNDAAIAVPFDEVIARAKFWQDYIQRYPESHFIKDAKFLFTLYRHALFFGSDNSQWTNDAVTEFIGPEYKQALEKLAKGSNSILAKDARTLLDFMATPNSKRNQAYPVPEVDEEGYEIQDWATARYQLNKALPIPSPWDNDNNRDCLSGIVCVDYDY